jgi:hypothetical protein
MPNTPRKRHSPWLRCDSCDRQATPNTPTLNLNAAGLTAYEQSVPSLYPCVHDALAAQSLGPGRCPGDRFLLFFSITARETWAPIATLQSEVISLDPANLPEYAMRTTLRMLAAMAAALIFTLLYGTLAAKAGAPKNCWCRCSTSCNRCRCWATSRLP